MGTNKTNLHEQEIQRLKDVVFHLKAQNQNLEKMLNNVTTARAFKLWQAYAGFKRKIFSLFQQSKEIIPMTVRKKIKSHVQEIRSQIPLKFTIENEIQKEWDMFNASRSESALDIFNFGIIAFNYRIQRPQHLALEMAKKGNRIFYIENEFLPYYGNSEKDSVPLKVTKQSKNVYRVTLYAGKDLFIYKDTPSSKDIEIMMLTLKALFSKSKAINTVSKIDHPFWAHLLEKLSMPVIYDCMDEHDGFKETGDTMALLEEKLYTHSDTILVSSHYLQKKVQLHNQKKVVIIKNAGEYTHFGNAAYKDFLVPWELDRIKRPIIGYYGAIADWFDAELIEQLAQRQPNASIVLIGRVENPRVRNLTRKYKNILLLGEKLYDDLPAYLQEFDICIIPFHITPLIKATSPVKVFEYMASGKPIVTTDIPELIEFKDFVYVSKTNAEFLNNVDVALTETGELKRNMRISCAKQNTWEKRASHLEKVVSALLFPKVSIVILTYNKTEETEECVSSILHKSCYPNFEIILVDNGSGVETVKLLKSYEKDNRVIVLFNKNNRGFSAGNNQGLLIAKGAYLIVLNNDTVITPGWISRLVFHASKSAIGIVGPITNCIGNEQQVKLSNQRQVIEYTYAHWGEELKLRNLAAFCWIIKKDLYQKIGGFDESYGKALFEDDDYCMSVRNMELDLMCADDVFIYHKGSATLGSNQTEEYKELFNRNKKYFEKKWGVEWVSHNYRH